MTPLIVISIIIIGFTGLEWLHNDFIIKLQIHHNAVVDKLLDRIQSGSATTAAQLEQLKINPPEPVKESDTLTSEELQAITGYK